MHGKRYKKPGCCPQALPALWVACPRHVSRAPPQGPGPAGRESVFFRSGDLVVRMGLSDSGPAVIELQGDGSARLMFEDIILDGKPRGSRASLPGPGLHHG